MLLLKLTASPNFLSLFLLQFRPTFVVFCLQLFLDQMYFLVCAFFCCIPVEAQYFPPLANLVFLHLSHFVMSHIVLIPEMLFQN